ncbi:hypothetical protein TD95_002505 [Thielaviopsis punctulata]|uniref:Ubiquinone biosynthesis protein n=1 Tax=Thielaviopsis punctulata TaxID=72032 RepID=A0A0F4ZGP5_9PEZI|nr:hypothetical protein TD95_002505 [Thielaviopsis punctulata]
MSTSILRRQALRLSRSRAFYHSYDHPAPSTPFSPTEQRLLGSAYAHVPTLGFTAEALTAGARDAGFPEITTAGLADGPFALVRWHLVGKRAELREKSADVLSEDKGLGVRERVERLTWYRLQANRTVIHKWQDALALMAQPSYLPESLKELAALTDDIYFLAGDVSVDPSWYTKRGSLGMIFASCELFMTNDRSPDFAETRAFLQRRLAERASVGGVASAVGQWTGFTASAALNVLRSKGVRV